MLEMMLGQMIAEPKTPRWLKDQRVLLLMRGEELWWTNGELMVLGAPPKGVKIVDGVTRLPADFGPSGDPEQVHIRQRYAQGTIALVSEAGGASSFAQERHINFLVDHLDSRPIFLRYPSIEGEPQGIAAFLRRDVQSPFGGGTAREYALVAILGPLTLRDDDTMSGDELAALPRMGGTDPLVPKDERWGS